MDQKLAPQHQKQLEQNIINGQIRQNMEVMLNLTNGCFESCVHKFSSKILDKEETTCIESCADRYFALTQRVGQKYQQYQYAVVQQEKLKKAQALENR